jgi:single-strand DNA-binding protein
MRWRDRSGNKQEKTEWHSIVAWGRLAETCAQYVTKGMKVFVSGRIETQSWDDKKTGEKRYRTQIVAEDVKFLSGGSGAAGRDAGDDDDRGEETTSSSGGSFPDDDDIPF